MTAALHPGRLLARRYRLIDQIGAGGMSVIWRARDEVLDRVVALKVLAPSLAADARFRDMVREEARAAAQLVHPHVTSVHDYGETVAPDGSITSFVVMELLNGEGLELRLIEGPLPWAEAVEVGAQVADALAAAHRLGIVHRDITPANVMMTAVGVKVLDFGIATRVGAPDEDEDGATFGTPAYVAPERLDGAPAQPATDVYSLGVLLHEALTGRVPYPAATWEQLSAALASGPPPTLADVPDLPPAVARICLRSLAKDPADRPTARQVATTMRDQLLPNDAGPGDAGPGDAGPGDAGPGDAGPGRSRRWPVLLLVPAVLAVGVALAVAALLPDERSAPQTRPTASPVAPTSIVPPATEPSRPATPPSITVSPDPRPGTLVEAANRVDALIGAGVTAGEIRADVGTDLRNELRNLRAAVGPGRNELAPPVARLREKVAVRLGEGNISQGYADRLDSAIAELGVARA
ncbi:protein kinase [Micromonospora sp. CPCC 205539]|uniref:serine/threonine-protein kinase n=1 Tax=Micromonospora sp. CPCC 205539 TaxID=3122408 RepID=UPI002FF24A95